MLVIFHLTHLSTYVTLLLGAERAYVYKHTDITDELRETVKEQDAGTFVREIEGKGRKSGESQGEEVEGDDGDVPFRISK